MRRRIILILALAALTSVNFSDQTRAAEKDDRQFERLKNFESDWIIAGLNRDGAWIDRFLSGELLAVPAARAGVETRTRAIGEMIDSAVARNPMRARDIKVRVTGSISVLGGAESESGGDMVAGNHSYYFLDTLNKRGGKWQIIATHFSRVSGAAGGAGGEPAGPSVRRLEEKWLAAIANKDAAALGEVLADDFTGVASSGEVFNKAQFVSDVVSRGRESTRAGTIAEMRISVYGDAVTASYLHSVRASAGGGGGGGSADSRTRNTDVWVKRNGEWQIVSHQQTRLP